MATARGATRSAQAAAHVGPLRCFTCGAFGGLAPALLELSERVTQDPAVDLGRGFWIPLVIHVILGGGLAFVKEEDTMWHAFTAGVLAPALIVGAAGLPGPADAGGNEGSLRLSAPVYAAEMQQPARARGGTRVLTITTDVQLSDTLVLIVGPGDSSQRPAPKNQDGDWIVPEEDFTLVLRATAHVFSSRVPVETPAFAVRTGTEPLSVELFLEQTFWGGVLDGLGFDRFAKGMIEARLAEER